MQKFKVKIDVYMDAEDINDAMLKLAKHFLDVVVAGESDICVVGNIDIAPFPEKEL